MKKMTSFLIASIALIGCTNHITTTEDSSLNLTPKGNDTAELTTALLPVDTAFKLESFEAIPDTIDGCGEYFTYDTSEIKNNQYIFLSNLTSFAIIKINGENVYLNKDEKESIEIDNKNYIAVYNGKGLEAILTIQKKEAYDEGGLYSGTLQIITDKQKATFKVHGESGC